ncbi:MAG: hypothetical protein SOR89_06645 [Ndongobacter sp.]|nr:hypothetical protein [Ndongobacter sp.]
MKRGISVILSIVLLLTAVSGCSEKKTENPIVEVKVTLPCATGPRATVEGEAILATQTYLLARAYFEKLEVYNMDSFHAREYSELLAEAVEAFRIAEAFSGALKEHAGILAELEEKGVIRQEKAAYELLSASADGVRYFPFVSVAHAAEQKSPAIAYAEEITRTFDNAKSGQKLKTLAQQYDTDVKRAKVMLEQAQAILEGAAYAEQADFENKCYQAAVETKAAASAIGFGVAVAATGGIAAGGGASLAGVIEAGGVAFSGVNAVIDMGTAVTIHTTNGEGNEYTAAWKKTNEMVAPMAALFSIGGGIQNIKDFRDPEKAAEAVNNAAQAFLVGVGLARDYVQEGAVLGVSSKMMKGYREIIVRCADANTEAAREVLRKTGIREEALEQAKSNSSRAMPVSEEVPQEGALGSTADIYIRDMGALADSEKPFDVDTFLKKVDEAFRKEAGLESAGGGEANEQKEGESVSAAGITPEPAPAPAESHADAEEPQTDAISGAYMMTTVNADGLADTFSAEVKLYADGRTEIRFAPHRVIVNDDLSMAIDTEHTGPEECLKGTFDPSTNTFTGMGDTEGGTYTDEQTGVTVPLTTYWNIYPTKLTFAPAFGTASGTMAEGERILDIPIAVQITMERNVDQ